MNTENIYEIGQAYIRFDFKANDDFKAIFKQYLLYKGKLYANEIYHKELFIDGFFFKVELEEGSLKARLKIFGQIAFSMAIGYGGLRATIDYIIKDSQMITERIVQDISKEPNINPNSIGKIERRLGVPGKIERVYSDLNKLRNNRQNLTENEQQILINRILKNYEELIYILDEPEIELIRQEIRPLNIPLRQPIGNDDIYINNRYAILNEKLKLISENEIGELRHLPPPTD